MSAYPGPLLCSQLALLDRCRSMLGGRACIPQAMPTALLGEYVAQREAFYALQVRTEQAEREGAGRPQEPRSGADGEV